MCGQRVATFCYGRRVHALCVFGLKGEVKGRGTGGFIALVVEGGQVGVGECLLHRYALGGVEGEEALNEVPHRFMFESARE